MNFVPFLIISEVASAMSSCGRTLRQMSELTGNWNKTASEMLQDRKSINVCIDTERLTQNITTYLEFQHGKEAEPFVKCDKWMANGSVHISQNGFPRKIHEEPLQLMSTRLLNATSSCLTGPDCDLSVYKMDKLNEHFPLDQFLNSLRTPFRQVVFSNCRGYALEIERIVALSMESGCTRAIRLENCDITRKTVDLLVKYWRNASLLAKNCSLQLELSKCSHQFTMKQVIQFFEDWRNGNRHFELTISNWLSSSSQFYTTLQRKAKQNSDHDSPVWRVERPKKSTNVIIIHNESGFKIRGRTLTGKCLRLHP
ncbi:hypothetical protein L596_029586 [Steinernema carpocapsae]|uniref:F-box associated domain-containing protein n=1 Tax=Steinernema carpocapsae TaxID=34508 RepID=A0A4U5LV26_STECR|nr:hypothetical protein L596_029586 [Steinernema carpocapsae]